MIDQWYSDQRRNSSLTLLSIFLAIQRSTLGFFPSPSPAICPKPMFSFYFRTLASGLRTITTGLVSAATILGDSLPDGEYRITAYMRPGQVVELEAGMADLAVP